MKPLTKLHETRLPEGTTLELWERDGFHFLLEDGQQVASSFFHGSDDAMAQLAAEPLRKANQPTFLFVGLGMGFVLDAVRNNVNKEKAVFVVAEPNADLVEWHKTTLEPLHPGMLEDPRVEIESLTSLAVARRCPKKFHAILWKSTHSRPRLSISEASDYCAALRAGGLLIMSLSRADKRLERAIQKAGFQVASELVPASHKGKQTSLHTLIIAKKGRYGASPSHSSSPQRGKKP